MARNPSPSDAEVNEPPAPRAPGVAPIPNAQRSARVTDHVTSSGQVQLTADAMGQAEPVLAYGGVVWQREEHREEHNGHREKGVEARADEHRRAISRNAGQDRGSACADAHDNGALVGAGGDHASSIPLAEDDKDRVRVVVVHRPRYDDWSFPKGKAEPGEAPEQTALREVAEETGMSCQLGTALGQVSYPMDDGRRKVVGFWTMNVTSTMPRRPDDEVDDVQWWTLDEAGHRLTHDQDIEILRRFVDALGANGD